MPVINNAIHSTGRQFMTKEHLREMNYKIGSNSDVMHWFSSSGTTGLPVVYPWTYQDEECALRSLKRIHPKEKFSRGGSALIIAPTGLPSMWAHMHRQLSFMGYATVFPGIDSPKRLLNLIPHIKPTLLMSLPLALTRLGELWQFSGGDHSVHPETIFVAGDVLSPARRDRLSSIWNAQVHNFYGISEIFGPLAAETEDPSTFAWQAPEVHVEILDPVTMKPVNEGNTGVAIFTTLWERPAQLIRYWSGDLFKLVSWLAPGQPRFIAKGRQQISLPGIKNGTYPVDIDQILLSDSSLGTEWTAELQSDRVTIFCESTNSIEEVCPQTLQLLENSFSIPVHLQIVSPGYLDRSRQKLGLPNLGETTE